MPDTFVTLQIPSTDVTADATEAVTDLEGVATFILTSHRLTESVVSAVVGKVSGFLEKDSVPLDATAMATFNLAVTGAVTQALEYSHLNGRFSVTFTVSDDVGPVADTALTLDATDGLTLDATEAVTDTDGVVTAEAVTAVSGLTAVDVTVPGIEDVFSVELGFTGPTIAGTAALGMSYPSLDNPRVGAMAIRVGGTSGLEILGQLEGGSLVTGLPGDGTWLDVLPIIPPSTLLSRDTAQAMNIGVFLLMIYNDSNNNGTRDNGEPIIASKTSGGVLVFLAPDDPETAPLAGWGLLDALEENPSILDWETASQELAITIYGAPVREPLVTGAVAGTAGDDRRTAWYVVDSVAFFAAAEAGNPFSVLLDPVASEIVLDAPIEADNTYSATALNPLDLLDPATLNSWKYVMPLGGGENLSQLLIVPMYYTDADLSGAYSAGDTFLGLTRPPVGAEWNVSYILQYPTIYSLMASDQLWMHNGYNWWASPLNRALVTVTANGPNWNLELDDTLPDGWVDVDFVIRPADADEDATPVAAGTFSTNGTEVITTTTCTGCGDVTAGMDLVIVENYERTTFLDWSESFNLGPWN